MSLMDSSFDGIFHGENPHPRENWGACGTIDKACGSRIRRPARERGISTWNAYRARPSCEVQKSQRINFLDV